MSYKIESRMSFRKNKADELIRDLYVQGFPLEKQGGELQYADGIITAVLKPRSSLIEVNSAEYSNSSITKMKFERLASTVRKHYPINEEHGFIVLGADALPAAVGYAVGGKEGGFIGTFVGTIAAIVLSHLPDVRFE